MKQEQINLQDHINYTHMNYGGFTPKQKIIMSIAGLVTILGMGAASYPYLDKADKRNLENKLDSVSINLQGMFTHNSLKNDSTQNPSDSSYLEISKIQDLDDYLRFGNPQDTLNVDTLKTFVIQKFGKYHLGQTSSMNSQTFVIDMNNDGYPDIVRVDPNTDDIWIYKNNIRDKLERKLK